MRIENIKKIKLGDNMAIDKNRRHRPIRSLLFRYIGILLLVFLLAFFLIFFIRMTGMLKQAENLHITEINNSISGVLDDAEANLQSATWDWSCWDDTYEFALGNSPDYIELNFEYANALDKLGINFVIITDMEMRVLYEDFYDLIGEAAGELPSGFAGSLDGVVSDFFQDFALIDEDKRLETHNGVIGYYNYNGQVYSTSIMPILHSDAMGDPAGIIVMGRVCDNANIQRMTRTDTFNFEISVPGEEELAQGDTVVFEGDSVISLYKLIDDIEGNKLIIKISQPRTVYLEGMQAVGMSSLFLIVSMILFVVILFYFLSRIVVKPLKELSADVLSVSGETAIDADKYSQNMELYTLGTSINEMLHNVLRAEKSSLAKSEFLSRMSHEMRTPMNAIIGMTSIARASGTTERYEYCLDRIETASKHLLGVINDILDMSKIEANKLELACSDFHLEKMLANITNVITFRIDEKKQSFHIYLDRSVPANLFGDEQRIAQVLTNLLSNAAKFTPENGEITLRINLIEETDNECTVQFSITDTGIGISTEQKMKLFRSFEQADGSISRKFGGTGLGLVISKRIVEMMGGAINVESEPGKGSTFTFTIKAGRGSSGENVAAPVLKKNIRVLAVDDSDDVLEYFRYIFEPLSILCDTASNGADALAHIKKNINRPYDVIFVDWMMPEMDGIELTRRIRRLTSQNSVVIMISAAEWSTIEDEAHRAGVQYFIPKPLFSSAVIDCINECMGNKTEPSAPYIESAENMQFVEKTVLLVDDVEINREIVIAMMEGTGLRIHCAENGKEAFEEYQSHPELYDLILMDIHMPEMDGFEATRKIRALSDCPSAQNVPIIAMTANVFREDIEKCLECGMNEHVGKPIDFNELMKKMSRLLAAE